MEEKDFDEKEALNGFFRFYEDGFEETRPMYEHIIGALSKVQGEDGKPVIPDEYTKGEDGETLAPAQILDNIIEKCKELDLAEVQDKKGKVKEYNIGLQGFFASLGYTENEKGKNGLEDAFEKIGDEALKYLPLEEGLEGDERRSLIEAQAFLGELAAGPYFPRLTCTSASHFMSVGSIMQIGCSQGKTSVVAMTTYEQLKMGKKVFSTSSAPGLVPENYDEARKFYEKMGIEEDFCCISQNMKDKTDHIVLFHKMKEGDPSLKYEIRADGTIRVEKISKENGKEKSEMESKVLSIEEIESLGLVSDGKGGFIFEASVKKMMADKGIIMGDTITLGKYQDLMPERNENGVIDDSFLIVDEADAELLDTQPQEFTGKEYSEKTAINRWNMRLKAKQAMDQFKGEPSDLEKYSKSLKIPLDFIVDAYEAKQMDKRDENGEPVNYQVKEGKIFVLNPNTNVMIPASQGLTQAILANDSELAKRHTEFKELEVLGETDIPKLFSNFEIASLMSGTMQDKGLSDYSTPEQIKAYENARQVFFTRCGNGVKTSALNGVIDWKLVTPKTREEKGDVIVGLEGIDRDNKGDTELSTIPTTNQGLGWREYLETNGEALEAKWKSEILKEAETRSKDGQPVMISVYGDRNPGDGKIPTYTDKNQIGSEENGTKDHKIKDDTCMFVNDGIGEIACFDDFYGRGYTFKFIDRKDGQVVRDNKDKPVKTAKGGHVLITSLPQNSRNLEQFLFRVARGGDKGSSSVMISPNDPVIVGYLEKLEKEQGPEVANAYFSSILSGQKKVMEMVADIYPEQTKELFLRKANEIDAIKAYKEALMTDKDNISKIGSLDKDLNIDEVLAAYESEYSKQIVKRSKLNRVAGVDPENEFAEIDDLNKVTIKNLIARGKLKNITEIVAILPIGLSQDELADIIPDEQIRESVTSLTDKISRYNEKQEQKKETETIGRDFGPEIMDATREDSEYNLSEVEKALADIQKAKKIEQQIISDKESEKEEGR